MAKVQLIGFKNHQLKANQWFCDLEYFSDEFAFKIELKSSLINIDQCHLNNLENFHLNL